MRYTDIYDYGFGVEWNDVLVTRRDGFYTSVTDYHEHDFYEINLILSGNVKILMKNRFEEGTQNRIVLTPPQTPHYISCKSDVMYSRLYLVFTRSFISNYFPEYDLLFSTFGKNGKVVPQGSRLLQKKRRKHVVWQPCLVCDNQQWLFPWDLYLEIKVDDSWNKSDVFSYKTTLLCLY